MTPEKHHLDPDPIIGTVALSREEIARRAVQGHSVLCPLCFDFTGGEITMRNRVEILKSDMPSSDTSDRYVPLLRCERCKRIWDPLRLEWMPIP